MRGLDVGPILHKMRGLDFGPIAKWYLHFFTQVYSHLHNKEGVILSYCEFFTPFLFYYDSPILANLSKSTTPVRVPNRQTNNQYVIKFEKRI